MEKRRGMQSLLQVLTAVLLVCGRGTHGISQAQTITPSGSGSGVVGSGVSGSGSGVSGSGMPGCISAGFCTCCVPSADQSCVINGGEVDMCSCDVGCFERDTCCFDITEVPCLPDIFVEFSPNTYTVTEGTDDYVNVTVRATGFPGPSFDVDSITILLTTESGSAEAGTDFEGVIRSLSFSSDGEWVVMIPILDNSPVELTEFFSVNLATNNPFVVFNNNVSSVEIRDNDVLLVELDQPEDTPESNGTAEVCVSVVSGVLQTGLEVMLSLGSAPMDQEDADDFASGPLQVTIASGDTTQCVEFPIRMDNLIEGPEVFSLHIISITIDPRTVSILILYRTIVILDSTVGTISVDPPQPVAVVEQTGTVEVCAVIGGAELERDVIVMLETTPLTATDPDDYSGGVFNLTFGRNTNRTCADITIAVDDIFEDDEVFGVSVFSDDSAIQPGSATNVSVIILDEAQISFDFTNIIGVYLVQESDGAVTVCVGITGGTLDREVVLMLNTSGQTALEGIDYGSVATALVFAAGESVVCADIPLTQDQVVETPETFMVILSSSDPDVAFVRDEATVNIVDSTQFVLEFVPVDYRVQESNGSVEVCVAQTSSPPVQFARDVPLLFNTFNGMASAPMDFTAVVNEMVDFPSTSCLTITIIDDGVVEPDESFTVAVTSSDPAVILGDDVATVTIADVEAPIGIEFPLYEVGEADGFQEVCVVANGLLNQDVQLFLLSRDVSTTSGTGGNSDDFVAVSEPLVLVAGSNPRTCVNITINDDAFDEISEETFVIDLTLLTSMPIFRNTTEVVIRDDDEVEVGFSPQEYTVSEGLNTAVTICVSLNGLLQRDGVTVRVTTSDVTAMSGSDYTSLNQTLVFNSGSQQMCVDIGILDDSVTEQTEVFSISLESVSGEGIFNQSAMVSILDDDIVFEFTNIPFTGVYILSESFGFGEICVGTMGILSREVIVTLNTSDVTATSPDDYTSTTVDLVFSMSTTQICINIALVEDLTVESVEEFSVRLSSSDLAVSFAMEEAQVFISDATTFVLGFMPVDYRVQESSGSVEVCVAQTSSPPVQFARDVPLLFNTFNGMASAPMDFTAVVNEMVDFPSTSCLTITIIDDGVVEPDESFTVAVTSNDPAVILGDDVATVTIADVEAPIGIEFPLYEVGEADGFQEVCVVANGALSQDVQVVLRSQDISANAGPNGDYVAVESFLTLMAGSSPRACVNVGITSDLADEINERFRINMAVVGSLWPTFRTTTEVVINDDDVVQVGFDPQEYTATEGLDDTVRVCVSLDRPLQRDGVMVQVSTADGSAQDAVDYISTTQTLVFNSGDLEMCVDIVIVDDDLSEQPETFSINLQSLSGEPLSNSMAGVTILSNDEGPVMLSFEQSAYAVTETDSSQILVVCVISQTPVTRNGITTIAFSFQFTDSATEDEDFLRVLETLTFNVGESRMCINVTILGDDIEEETERFPMQIFSPEFGQSSTIVTINDDDGQDPPVFGFENPGELIFDEDAGTVPVCVVLESGTVSQPTVVTVTSDQSGSTATANEDYVSVFQALTFTPGASTRMCVNLVILDDQIGENDETLTLRLSTGRTATVTIRDNDPVEFRFGQNAYTVNEGASLTVSVVANRLFENGPFQLNVRSQDGTATSVGDFTAINQDIVFSGPVSLTISTNSDSLTEGDEQFTLILTNTMTGAVTTATVTIIDIIQGPVFGFENPQLFVFDEDDGRVEICVVLESGTVSQPTVVTVTSDQLGGTATAGRDYSSVSDSVTFTAGASTRMCVNLVILDDQIGENDETLTLRLSTGRTATVTIRDNDPVEFRFGQNAYTVNEGASLTVSVVANRLFENGPFQLNVRSQDGTATSVGDFTAINQDIVFSGPVFLTISTNSDSLTEGDEQFTLILTNTMTGDMATATVTIANVAVVGASVGLELSAYTVSEEDEAVRVCVSLTQQVSSRVVVTVSTSDGTATAGSDYVARTVTLTFAEDDLRECVEIDLIDDSMGEPLESFTVLLSGSTLPFFRSLSRVNILQDQDGQLIVTLQEPIMAADEGISTFPVCVDLVGSNLNRDAVVTLTTIETGAALENVDYIRESMDITYFSPIEEVIICENITIIHDTLSEDIELFGVTLTSSDSAVSFIVSSGVIIIVDNDNPSLSAGFVQTDVGQPETDGLTGARLRAFVNGRITQPVALSVSVAGGTATVNDDFTDSMAVLQFNINSDNPRRVFYTINGDTIDEPDETIVFQLSGPSGVALIPDRSTAVVTIINDDMFPIETGIIVLVDGTPEVRLEGGTGTVRVQFTLSPDITNALCTLRDVAPQQDCSSGTFVVTGLAPSRIPPVTLEIAALNQQGQQVAFISRTIRLGLSGDCSVNFLNGVEGALVFQGDVFIAFSVVGPTTSTECQLDGGTFTPCDRTVQYENLSLGEHRVKVRPNGDNCVRRIRRTVMFTVV